MLLNKYRLHALALFRYTNDRVLRQLEPGSELLQEQQTLYGDISHEFVTKYMYETVPMEVAPRTRLLVRPHSSNSDVILLTANRSCRTLRQLPLGVTM